MPILKLKPCYKDYLWGGSAFRSVYNRDDVPFDIAAESWEAACHKNGSSVIDGGEYDGLTLDEAAVKFGEGFYKTKEPCGEHLHVLFKLIDARQKLSLQVHPDDEYAKRDNENGKTEMWVVLRAEENAYVYAGFEEPVTKEEFRRHIEQQTLEEILHKVYVSAGDAVMIPAGLVHAIGEGLLIAEVQQNSDATYRVYDWGRVGADGKPRDLHIEKSLDVSNTSLRGHCACGDITQHGGLTIESWPKTQYFSACRGSGSGIVPCGEHPRGGHHYRVLFAASGNLTVNGTAYPAGTTLFVTADTPDFTIASEDYFLMFN